MFSKKNSWEKESTYLSGGSKDLFFINHIFYFYESGFLHLRVFILNGISVTTSVFLIYLSRFVVIVVYTCYNHFYGIDREKKIQLSHNFLQSIIYHNNTNNRSLGDHNRHKQERKQWKEINRHLSTSMDVTQYMYQLSVNVIQTISFV